ncbi:UNVERIFIED_CONTAM: hypothetical protein PYX00_002050 [Menopon gallinae]|uniref:HIG1 domain-containing protein n=1 Tax=Menopon gallinae TaxID=328185 RepID=A0AAW2IGL5_9NEOP
MKNLEEYTEDWRTKWEQDMKNTPKALFVIPFALSVLGPYFLMYTNYKIVRRFKKDEKFRNNVLIVTGTAVSLFGFYMNGTFEKIRRWFNNDGDELS